MCCKLVFIYLELSIKTYSIQRGTDSWSNADIFIYPNAIIIANLRFSRVILMRQDLYLLYLKRSIIYYR